MEAKRLIRITNLLKDLRDELDESADTSGTDGFHIYEELKQLEPIWDKCQLASRRLGEVISGMPVQLEYFRKFANAEAAAAASSGQSGCDQNSRHHAERAAALEARLDGMSRAADEYRALRNRFIDEFLGLSEQVSRIEALAAIECLKGYISNAREAVEMLTMKYKSGMATTESGRADLEKEVEELRVRVDDLRGQISSALGDK